MCSICGQILDGSTYPKSGYCNECIKKHELYAHLREKGFMTAEDQEMDHKIKGRRHTGDIWVNGRKLHLEKCREVWGKYLPTLNWYYDGAWLAKLALGILLELVRPVEAVQLHEQFKLDVVKPLPVADDFEIDLGTVQAWIEHKRRDDRR